MRRRSLLVLVCLASLALVFLAVSPPASGGGDEARRLVSAGAGVQIELIGDSSYRVSVDGGRFSRKLPRSGLLHLRYGTFDPAGLGRARRSRAPEGARHADLHRPVRDAAPRGVSRGDARAGREAVPVPAGRGLPRADGRGDARPGRSAPLRPLGRALRAGLQGRGGPAGRSGDPARATTSWCWRRGRA